MSDPVRVARYGGVHANLTVVITALSGKSAGLQWTFKTLESMNHDLAPKYASVGGTQVAPVNTVLSDAAPKWDGEINMIEAGDIQAWLGPGWAGIPLNISATWQVPGNPAYTDLIYTTFLGACSVSSKKGDVTKAKIGAECAAIHPRGIDPFAAVP